jgi:hypothetical protein
MVAEGLKGGKEHALTLAALAGKEFRPRRDRHQTDLAPSARLRQIVDLLIPALFRLSQAEIRHCALHFLLA